MFLRDLGVFAGMVAAIMSVATVATRKQIAHAERDCRCACRMIDNLHFAEAANAPELVGTSIAKEYVWFGSPIVCVQPNDPNPRDHLQQLQDKAHLLADAPHSFFERP